MSTYKERTESENTRWICVYKDAVCPHAEIDNLVNIEVPESWLFNALRALGERDIEKWFDEYTADDTDPIARNAVIDGVILDCDNEYVMKVITFHRENPQLTETAEKAKLWIDRFGENIPEGLGFSCRGMWVNNPFYDESLRFEVDPFIYYGEENMKSFLDHCSKFMNEKDKSTEKKPSLSEQISNAKSLKDISVINAPIPENIFRYQYSVYYGDNKHCDFSIYSKEKPDISSVSNAICRRLSADIEKEDILPAIDSITEISMSVETHEGEYVDSDWALDCGVLEDIIKLAKVGFDSKYNSGPDVESATDLVGKFVFDDEVYCGTDEAYECVDSYLIATDVLVDRLSETLGYTLEDMDCLDNINFYACYNVKESFAKLVGTYWYFEGGKETQAEFEIALSKEEQKDLIESLEAFSVKRYKQSCLDWLNGIRGYDGKALLDKPKEYAFGEDKLMKNDLTEKLLFNTQHGLDCSLEVCVAGKPDEDKLICSGPAGDCLRKLMLHELSMTGDEYFSFTTKQNNYCGNDFEEISWRMGYNPQDLRSMLLPPNLKEYDITIHQELEGHITIQAESKKEALKLADEKYNGRGEELPDMDDIGPLTFSAIELSASLDSNERKPSLDSRINAASAKNVSNMGNNAHPISSER